jgi:hypothetical protein
MALTVTLAAVGAPVVLAACAEDRAGTEAERVVDFEPIAARTDADSQTVALQDAPLEPENGESGANRPAPPLTRGRSQPASTPPNEPLTGYEPILVHDLLTDRAIRPVVFAELPVAEMDAERAVSAIPLHVPGCVGSAKRYWVIVDEGEDPAKVGNPGLARHPCSGPGGDIPIRLRGFCANPERDAGLPAMCGPRNAADRGGSRGRPPGARPDNR